MDDIVQAQYLTICSSLRNLTLEGNPLCVAPSPGEESVSIFQTVTSLSVLVCIEIS